MAEEDDRRVGTVVRTPGGGYARGLLQPGQVLMGTYRIHKMVGSPGGMGQVYEAEDETLGTRVAIKVPALEILLTEDGPERFLKEARTAARLRPHPHIVQIYLCHADPAVTVRVGGAEIPIPFIVMEYLGGGDLAALIQHGLLDLPTVSAVFTDMCSAIQYAHAYRDDERAIRAVIHRDLKPENICFDERGRLVIVDFGIAKVREGGRSTSTTMAGTPTYMAPEQWNAKGIDHRTDIYALGVILFQMVTGQPPFDAGSYEGLIAGHLFHQPPDPRSLRPELPQAVAGAILKALEKDKAARFESAEQFAQAVAAGFKGSAANVEQIVTVQSASASAAQLAQDSGVQPGVQGEPQEALAAPTPGPVSKQESSAPSLSISKKGGIRFAAVRQALEKASNANEIRCALSVCYEGVASDGSVYGAIDGEVARSLFEGLTAERFTKALASSNVHSLCQLASTLREISEALGEPACEELQQLETAIWREARPALERAKFAWEIESAIILSCCENQSLSGTIDGEAARNLFEGLKAERFAKVLAASDSNWVHSLATTLREISEDLGEPACEGLEQLRAALD